MQDLVAEPLEKRIQELTWYDRVETTTRPGYAFLTVTLKDSMPASRRRQKSSIRLARSLATKPEISLQASLAPSSMMNIPM